ncbi:hypothetical protein [Marmoricola sp. RAF53]|uniref:hypothetical protein n=1 Tax=Marmoricola sp. RAF53 TaxID=3233059 RepID=UPI003F996A33
MTTSAGGGPDRSPVRDRVRRSGRPAAVVTVTMAGLVSAEAATGPRLDSYVLALVGTLVLGSVVVAGRLWQRPTFETALGAAVLALLTGAGQTLVATVGGPGSTGARWTGLALAVVGSALVVLGLVGSAADAPSSARDADEDRPYAL